MSQFDPLLCDPAEKAQLETANGVEQIDYIAHLVNEQRIRDVRESHVLQLHGLAVAGIYPCGGQYRNALRQVRIEGSEHRVPHESSVPGHVRDLLAWLEQARQDGRSALERAGYTLWRLNWIHPFAGGNGRTSRATTYLILCMDMGMMLPGVPTVPSLIYERRDDYVAGLRVADTGERDGGTADLSVMSAFLQDVVTRQLAAAIDSLAKPKS